MKTVLFQFIGCSSIKIYELNISKFMNYSSYSLIIAFEISLTFSIIID